MDHVIHYGTGRGSHSIKLERSQMQQYKAVVLRSIRRFADNDKLPSPSQGGSSIRLYARWAELSSREETGQYLGRKIRSADDAISFVLQFAGVWHTIGKSNHTYRDLTLDAILSIDAIISIDTIHQIITSDPRYGNLINTKESDLVLFERPRVRDIHTTAKVGNEKSPEFKEAMVKQFIYLFNKRREAKE